jgi:hypothetical protein
MRPVVVFGLSWQGVKRLASLLVRAVVLVFVLYAVWGIGIAIVGGVVMLIIARALFRAVRSD